jgi:predicted porin
MKAKLLAVAIAAALPMVASAQSNVTMSGRMKVGIESAGASGNTAANGSGTRTRLMNQSSHLTIRGTEDLGGGLRAFFEIGTDVAGDHATSGSANFSNRDTWVGLSGGWGAIQFGHGDNHFINTSVIEQSVGGLALPGHAMVLNLTNRVQTTVGNVGKNPNVDNAIRYTSPNLNGFNARVTYSFENDALGSVEQVNGLNTRSDRYDVDLSYANHGFFGLLTFHRNNNVSNAAAGAHKQSGYQAGLAYQFGFGLKAGLLYDSSKLSINAGGSAKRGVWAIPLSYSSGAHTVVGNYARARNTKGTLGGANTGASMVSIGYDYALSKRTSVGVSYTKISNRSAANNDYWTRGVAAAGTGVAAAVSAGADPRSFYFGVKHLF